LEVIGSCIERLNSKQPRSSSVVSVEEVSPEDGGVVASVEEETAVVVVSSAGPQAATSKANVRAKETIRSTVKRL